MRIFIKGSGGRGQIKDVDFGLALELSPFPLFQKNKYELWTHKGSAGYQKLNSKYKGNGSNYVHDLFRQKLLMNDYVLEIIFKGDIYL